MHAQMHIYLEGIASQHRVLLPEGGPGLGYPWKGQIPVPALKPFCYHVNLMCKTSPSSQYLPGCSWMPSKDIWKVLWYLWIITKCLPSQCNWILKHQIISLSSLWTFLAKLSLLWYSRMFATLRWLKHQPMELYSCIYSNLYKLNINKNMYENIFQDPSALLILNTLYADDFLALR